MAKIKVGTGVKAAAFTIMLILAVAIGYIAVAPSYVVPVYMLIPPPPSLTKSTQVPSTTTITGMTTTYTTTYATSTYTGPWTLTTTTTVRTTTSMVRAHVADTWVVAEVRFKDGSTQRITGSSIPARLQLQYSGKDVKDVSFGVPAVGFPPPPSDPSFSYILAIETRAKITVNGRTVYSEAPFLGIPEMQWQPSDYGNLKSTWSLKNFDVNAATAGIPEGSKITVEVLVEQHWWLIKHGAHYVQTVGETYINIPHSLSFIKPRIGEADFAISLSPTGIELGRTTGNTKTVSIGLLSIGEFSSPVSLSISGLPQGVTASFEASTVDMAPGKFSSSSVTLTCSSSAVSGSYTATITAMGGGITHTAQLGITIMEEAKPDQYRPGLFSRLSISAEPSTVKPGGTVEIHGSLVGITGEGISDRRITLTSDFNWTATAITGGDGGFSTSLKAPSGEGLYTVSASFAGDDTYASASDRTSFTVKAEGVSGLGGGLGDVVDRVENALREAGDWIGEKTGISSSSWIKYGIIIFIIIIAVIIIAAIAAVIARMARWSRGGGSYYRPYYKPYYRRYYS